MKKIKRIISILCIIIMLPCLVPCTTAFADTGYSYSESEVTKFVDDLIRRLINMSDDELLYYIENTVGWEQKASIGMQSYRGNKAVGEYISDGDTFLKEDGDRLILTKKIFFKKATIEATVIMADIGNQLTPIDVTYKTLDDSNKSMADKMANAAFNTVIGMSSVFLVLLLISFIISLFKYIPKLQGLFDKRKKENESIAEVKEEVLFEEKVLQPDEELDNEENTEDDTELVAVIMAAICAMTGVSSDSFVVRSIKRVDNRRKR